ncbi:MAG: hypothetical protein K8T25_18420 [Planctomycetia bacterium]|nr:hypothetical protein [Planctomycetia bacterium]
MGGLNDSLTLHLGPPNSGSEYETIWWAGFAGGMGLFLLSGLVRVMRAKRAKSQGAPAV